MKIKELIAELQVYDAELDVVIFACGNGHQEIRELLFNRDDEFGTYLSIEGDA